MNQYSTKTTNSQNPVQPIATLSHFIAFHGINLMVYQHQGTAYVPLKAIVDLIGTDWRTAKRSAIDGDNQILYGTIRLVTPFLDNTGGLMTPQTSFGDTSNDSSVGLMPQQNTVFDDEIDENLTVNSKSNALVNMVCIRLDRVTMYLARVNTARLRSNGNISSADYLLSLQQEWANALHSYETYGVAVKNTLFDNTKQLKMLADIYSKLNDSQQKAIVARQIDYVLGVQRPNQNDLFSQGGA
nr:hypothetical protein [uncultured Moraxella sp.]